MSVAAYRPAAHDFSHAEFDIHQPDTRQQPKHSAIPRGLKGLFTSRVSDTTSHDLVQDADDFGSHLHSQLGASKFDKVPGGAAFSVFGNAAYEGEPCAAQSSAASAAEPSSVRHNNLFENPRQHDQRASTSAHDDSSDHLPTTTTADASAHGPSIIAGFFRKTISPNSTIRTDEPLGTLVQAFADRNEEAEAGTSSDLPSPPQPPRALVSWEIETKQMMTAGMRDEAMHRAAPSQGMIRCYVKRSKSLFGTHSSYEMYLESGDLFLLAARKRKKTKMSTYVISQDLEDLKRDTENCMAKLKANFVGTEYMLWGKGGDKDVRKGYDSEDVCLSFQNMVGKKSGPRVMHVILPVPDSGWQPSAVDGADSLTTSLAMAKSKTLPPYMERNTTMLCSKPAEYSEASKGYTLDFQGRVKEASVKNFQLVAWNHNLDQPGSDTLLQFGKVDSNTYALDFAYPMSIQSAFAIALASIDTKLCCTV